jgi:putative transposase
VVAPRVTPFRKVFYPSPCPGVPTSADQAILATRHALYIQAQQRNPARWSGKTRDWSYIGVVTLNPERDAVVNMATGARHTQQVAA